MWRCGFIFGAIIPTVEANWLLQCSTCQDQTYYSDEKLKTDIRPANTEELLKSVKDMTIHKFKHRESEHFNKFFDQEQLGVLAQELKRIMPSAVAMVPERRYTASDGRSAVQKDVMMVRDSHLLFSALGALHQLAHNSDGQREIVTNHEKAIMFVKEEQDLNKKKREDIMEQVLRAMASTEVLAKAVQGTELRFSDLETSFALLKQGQKQNMGKMRARIAEVEAGIVAMKDILEKEAHADLTEKRRRAEADLEKTKVLKEIEALRYEEEQKTIRLRNSEQKKSERAIMEMHKDKIKFEQEKRKESELALMQEREASELRQHAEKAKSALQLKKLELEQQQRSAELELEQAVEKAKIEQEAKIRELRENEDVHARQKKLEMDGQKRQVIAAIQASAKIAMVWLSSLYSSSENMLAAMSTVFALIAAVYFTREMAVLLREQLNKTPRPAVARAPDLPAHAHRRLLPRGQELRAAPEDWPRVLRCRFAQGTGEPGHASRERNQKRQIAKDAAAPHHVLRSPGYGKDHVRTALRGIFRTGIRVHEWG